MRFLIYENYEDPWKIWLFFWWRHNRSRWRHNILKFAGVLDFGLIFSKKQSSLKFDIPAACWIKVQAPYFLNSIIEKSTNSKENPQTRPFFFTKSTMLNPMVQSDLVTYRGGTIVILFLQATIPNRLFECIFKIGSCETDFGWDFRPLIFLHEKLE